MSETAIEKNYELRSLNASDIFMMSKILSSIGIKEFRKCFDSENIGELVKGTKTEDAAAKVGVAVMFDIAGIVLDNLPSCEKYVYAFLANLSGLKADEIAALPMAEFAEMVVDVIKKEDFRDFIKVVSRSFK